ncbi:hypothetical protein [Roseibium alexandrii]|uniref:hypothetical protein n=1 Tax=Roseibium alexandrii TaxID=388408 RepID=UPI0037504BFA
MTPMDVTVIFILLFATAFLYIAIKSYDKERSYNKYFFASKTISKNENAASYVARFTSLATVMAFFLVYAQYDGLYLLVAPVTVLLGVLVFSKILEKAKYKASGTLPKELERMYNSKGAGFVALFISGTALTVVLLIEIYLGVTLLSVFVSDTPGGLPFVVMFVTGIAILYTGIGGLSAVISTDKIQAYLIYITVPCLILAFFIGIGIGVGEIKYFPRAAFEIKESVFDSVFLLPIPLLLNILTVNLLLLPSLLSSWQLLNSSPNLHEFTRGISNGGRSVLILWSLFIVLGLVIGTSKSEINGIYDIFNILRNSNNLIITYVLFPLLFVGCFAALLSTADSAILPIAQSIYDNFRKNSDDLLNRKSLWSILLMLWVVIVLLYVLFFDVLNFDFISILFTVFGLSVVMTPAIFLGILAPKLAKRPGSGKVAIFSMLTGFVTSIGFVTLGKISNESHIIQLGAPFGAIAATLALSPFLFKAGTLRNDD